MRYFVQYQVHSLVVIMLAIYSISPTALWGALNVEAVDPTVGMLNQNLEVTLTGEGFDETTRVSMSIDSGNKMDIIGSVDTPENTLDVAVAGNTAYVADGDGGLKIIDISNPADPRIIGSVESSGSSESVTLVGHTAYVANNKSGLQIIDIGNPTNPRIIGTVGTPGVANDVAVVGDTAYLADHDSGLQVIDISNPASPQIIGSVKTPGAAYDVAVVGQTAYLAIADNDRGLVVIDVGNRTRPRIIGSVKTPGYDSWHVTVVGNTAYLADGLGGLQVIDVGNPTRPGIIGSVDIPNEAKSVMVAANRAYVAAGDGGLQIIDVSKPANPRIIGSVGMPDKAEGVAVVGHTAYVANGIGGFRVIDVSKPTRLQFIGSVDTPHYACGIAVVGHMAYVADGDGGLQVVDVSKPASPRIISPVELPGWAEDVTVVDHTAYVANYSGGLQVVDVRNPGSPRVIGSVGTSGDAHDVAVVGNTAYVADKKSGLHVIDVSNPESPRITGSVVMPEMAKGVAVVGHTVYVANGAAGLQVVDASKPSSPKIVGFVDTPDSAEGVTVVGDKAYVADGEGGLRIVNVSNPDSPQIVGHVDTPDVANGVTVVGNIAYVEDENSGIQVIDVSDPVAPQIIGSVDTPGSAGDVAIIDNKAFVADASEGLVIVPVPVEIIPITVKSDQQISLTLPSPAVAGHYTLRVFNHTQSDERISAVTFMADENYQAQEQKRAIIVAGYRNYPDDTLWPMTQKSADMAYLALTVQGYSKENIYYISPAASDVDGDGSNDVDADATKDHLEYAIKSWTDGTTELVLFMTDHGGTDTFQLNNNYKMSVHDLDGWLDEIQGAMTDRVIFVYDACKSGSFVSKLLPPAGKERIVITSTDADEYAWFENDGVLSFSYQFWSHIMLDAYLYKAVSAAIDMMSDQTPLFDANGNGIANEKQDNIAQVIIGRGRVAGATPPTVQRVSEPQTIYGTASVDLWASDVNGLNPIVRVWAVILPPSERPAHAPITHLATVDLTDPDKDGKYTGSHDAFAAAGLNRVFIYAEDEDGAVSKPAQTTVYQAGPDRYEEDDSHAQATAIVLNDTAQRHNFHDAGDDDWVKFYGVSGEKYTVKAYHLGSNCDVVIELYAIDGTTLLQTQDTLGNPGADESLDWSCAKDGIYYLKIRDHENGFGENMDYDLSVYRPIAPQCGNIQGYVRDAGSGAAISGAVIKTDNNSTAISLANGAYLIFHDPGTFNMTVSARGYAPASTADVQVPEGAMVSKDFKLTTSTADKPIETTADDSNNGNSSGGGGGGCFISTAVNNSSRQSFCCSTGQ